MLNHTSSPIPPFSSSLSESSEGKSLEQLGMDSSPLIVAPDTLLKDVVVKMSQSSTACVIANGETAKASRRSSYVLVVANGTLRGIVTERDLVKLIAQGVSFAETSVLLVMTAHIVTLKASDIKDIFTPINLMRQHRIRHLPVLLDHEQVCGVFTAARLRQALPASALLRRRQVREVMATQIITASPDATVMEAAQLMATHRVSCVVIQESNEHGPQGIITEYDIVQIQRLELSLKHLTTETVMSSPLVCIHPDDQLWDVKEKMEQLHVRRLVVVNDQDKLAGLVTQTSILSMLDPQEMASTIEMLQKQVERLQDERVKLLQERNFNLETQVQTSETSLLVCEEKFRATFEQVAVGIAHISLNGQFMAVNQGFGNILGYKRANLFKKHFTQLTDSENHFSLLRMSQKLIRGEKSSFSQEQRYCRRDGSVFWGNVTVSVATQPSGEPDYLIVVLEDISSRKQAEIELQRLNQELEARVSMSTLAFKASEHRYRMLFEFAPDMLFILNLQGEIQKANAAAVRQLGYPESELIGQSLQTCFMPGELEIKQKDFESLLETGTHRKEMEIICREGQIRPVDCACSLITKTLDEAPHILVILRDISTRILLEAKLRSSEQQMRTVFEAMHDLVLIVSMHKSDIVSIEVTPTALQDCGQETENLAEQTLQFLWDHIDKSVGRSLQQVISAKEAHQHEYNLEVKGHQKWFMANISPLSEETVLWVARDITALKEAEKALFQEKELAQVTLESIGDAVITTDKEGNIYQLNPVAEQLTGWKTSETQGRPLCEVFHILHEKSREPAENPIQKALREEQVVSLANHTVLIDRNGTEYAIEDSAAPIRDREGQVIGAVMVFHDVTHSRNLTRQLSWQASHDPLTKLANRRKFDQILLNTLKTIQVEHQHHVLCFLDLDQFKIINDTCGHAAGDEVLRQVATLLQKAIRVTDTLARMGGDEFAIILQQCPLKRAMDIMEKLRQTIQIFRFQWEDKTFCIGVSIGLVEITPESDDSEALVGAADAACYAAKAKGRNRIQIFQDSDETVVQQRHERQWSVKIKQALEKDLFCLYGQAIVPTDKNLDMPRYCEILLRMVDEQGNFISAGVFIPAAERYNLMLEIDRWVINKFLIDYELVEHKDNIDRFMINLSGTSIGDEQFLIFLKDRLKQYPLAAKKICFEITETVIISNLNHAIQFIDELKQLGCSFALDDFGAGMSSFAYLKTLPVDFLKVDGQFMQDILENPATLAMVESINHIGHVMGLKTIAEFVSSNKIRDKLQEINVNYVQGFHISVPQALQL